MGVILCKKHGRQGIVFVADTLLEKINYFSVNDISKVILEYEKIDFKYFIDNETVQNLAHNSFVFSEIFNDGIKPMCISCFNVFMEKIKAENVPELRFLLAPDLEE